MFIPREVMSGPFKGMRYLNTSVGSVYLPKIIGTYEDELHEILNHVKSKNYSLFIDVGAAEGYYAIGVKKYLLPTLKKAVAFEATVKGRKSIKKLGHINNIKDIHIEGFCDVDSLSNQLSDEKTFILVDIEGGEYDLLNPEKIEFKNCDILVEIHTKVGMNDETLINKFNKTHTICKIDKRIKRLPETISCHDLIRKNSNYVTNEFRGPQSWLFMESKNPC